MRESKRTCGAGQAPGKLRSEEHTSELQSPDHLVCRLLLEKKKHERHADAGAHAVEHQRRRRPREGEAERGAVLGRRALRLLSLVVHRGAVVHRRVVHGVAGASYAPLLHIFFLLRSRTTGRGSMVLHLVTTVFDAASAFSKRVRFSARYPFSDLFFLVFFFLRTGRPPRPPLFPHPPLFG